MKIIIELEVDQEPVPGNLNHLIALLENPASRNKITIRHEND